MKDKEIQQRLRDECAFITTIPVYDHKGVRRSIFFESEARWTKVIEPLTVDMNQPRSAIMMPGVKPKAPSVSTIPLPKWRLELRRGSEIYLIDIPLQAAYVRNVGRVIQHESGESVVPVEEFNRAKAAEPESETRVLS